MKLTPQERIIDNQINKLNKRIMKLGKSGMELSKTYQELTSAVERFKAQAIMSQTMGPMPASGHKGSKSPVNYVNITTASGAIIQVPQIARTRSALALGDVFNSILAEAEAAGTGAAERQAMKDYLEEVFGGVQATDADISQALESDWTHSDMLSYVWDMLYGLEHNTEVYNFLHVEVEGHEFDEENNKKAVQLYKKYHGGIDRDSVRKRPLNKQQKAYLFGGKNPNGPPVEGLVSRRGHELAAAINQGSAVQQAMAARDYLSAAKASGSYGDSDQITYYNPSSEEVQNLIDEINGAVDFAKNILGG